MAASFIAPPSLISSQFYRVYTWRCPSSGGGFIINDSLFSETPTRITPILSSPGAHLLTAEEAADQTRASSRGTGWDSIVTITGKSYVMIELIFTHLSLVFACNLLDFGRNNSYEELRGALFYDSLINTMSFSKEGLLPTWADISMDGNDPSFDLKHLLIHILNNTVQWTVFL